jgi:hypothetical protein
MQMTRPDPHLDRAAGVREPIVALAAASGQTAGQLRSVEDP